MDEELVILACGPADVTTWLMGILVCPDGVQSGCCLGEADAITTRSSDINHSNEKRCLSSMTTSIETTDRPLISIRDNGCLPPPSDPLINL
jgi:hypothetical protein